MIDNLKIYLLNTSVFLISLSKIEAGMKIILLMVSIAYTTMKIIDWFKDRKKNGDKN